MNDQINQPSSPSPDEPHPSKVVEPADHKRARLKAKLPLRVRVISVTGELRDLDVAHYSKNCPLSVRETSPLPTLREIYEASLEMNPHSWLTTEQAAKHYRCSESTINRWIGDGALRSVIVCSTCGARPMRRIYRPDLDILVAKLASSAPNSKWAAVAAATPSIVELRRAKRRRARQAAHQAEFKRMFQHLSTKEFFEMAVKVIGT